MLEKAFDPEADKMWTQLGFPECTTAQINHFKNEIGLPEMQVDLTSMLEDHTEKFESLKT